MSIPEQEAGDCALMNSPFALEDSLCGKSVPKTVALQFCDLTTETRCKRQNTARNNKREECNLGPVPVSLAYPLHLTEACEGLHGVIWYRYN